MNKKFFLILLFLCLVLLFRYFDVQEHLSVENLKLKQQEYRSLIQAEPLKYSLLYLGFYILLTSLSLPGGVILTLAGGSLFGFKLGLFLVSIASTTGATLAFLSSRYLFFSSLTNKHGQKLERIQSRLKKEGWIYLLTIRLIPLFPFFVVNLVMGLTPIRLIPYVLVTYFGMIPGSALFVNAGEQISRITSPSDVLTPQIIGSFVLIGCFPLLMKCLLSYYKKKISLRGYHRPKKFDYNLIVIGAGAGGLVSSYLASLLKSKVALIEKHKMGGDCLNTGCVPSKTLLKTASVVKTLKEAQKYGIAIDGFQVQFENVMKRVFDVIKKIEPHDSVKRYTKLGVDCYQGEAKIQDPYRISIGDKTLTTRNIIIASGARPFVPPISGVNQITPLTSDTVWNLKELPSTLTVLGGGPIGCELAQCFQRLGSQVTIIEQSPRLLMREDKEVSKFMQTRFKSEGIIVLTKSTATEIQQERNSYELSYEDKHGISQVLKSDQVLFALGREARITGFGLEDLGVELKNQRTIEANEFLQTNFPNIFACGDVVGPYQFTHVAAHQATYATLNALFGNWFRINNKVIPWCTFTSPEVARVGLNQSEAEAQGIEHHVYQYSLTELDRAITEGEDEGFIKVLTPKKSDKILGVTIVASHAGELLTEYLLCMKYGLGLKKILGTIHPYPTFSEANKAVAGLYKKAQTSERVMTWLEKYHSWKR